MKLKFHDEKFWPKKSPHGSERLARRCRGRRRRDPLGAGLERPGEMIETMINVEPNTPPKSTGVAVRHTSPPSVLNFPGSPVVDSSPPPSSSAPNLSDSKPSARESHNEASAADDGVATVECKRVSSLEARLVALQAELEAARATVHQTDSGCQSMPNVNDASQATVKRRCRGFGADTAWRLVQVRARHGPFVSWSDLRQRVEGVGEALLKELQRRFALKPVRNVNTASSEDLEDAELRHLLNVDADTEIKSP